MVPHPDSDADSGADADPFLAHLRARLDGAESVPSPLVWAKLSPQLPAPSPWLTRYVGLGVGLGLVLGLLIGWWLPVATPRRSAPARIRIAAARLTAPPAAPPVSVGGGAAPDAGGQGVAPVLVPAPARLHPRLPVAGAPVRVAPAAVAAVGPLPASGSPAAAPVTAFSLNPPSINPAGGSLGGLPALAPATGSVPAPVLVVLPPLWASAVAGDSAIRSEIARVALDSPATVARRRAHLLALLAAQQPVLLGLQAALDSMRAVTRVPLPTEPTAAPIAQALAPDPGQAKPAVGVPTDSSRLRPLAAPRRWAVQLTAERTTAWGALPGHNPHTTHEQLLEATTRSVALEYRLPGATGAAGRWSVRAGLGDTRLRDQFRFAADTVHHTTHYDTTWASVVSVRLTRDSTFTVRPDSVGHTEPVIGPNGQVIGYQTVYVHYHDTTYHITTRHDTLRTMRQNVNTHQLTSTERRRQDLRPEYRFWTLPLAAQFEVVRRRRWGAGLSVGAQVLVFRGGSRPVLDGATGTYALRPVGVAEGPFRPISLQLTSGLDVHYRLTDRLAVLVGGAARGWAVGPLRAGTVPRTTWATQVGLRWELGR